MRYQETNYITQLLVFLAQLQIDQIYNLIHPKLDLLRLHILQDRVFDLYNQYLDIHLLEVQVDNNSIWALVSRNSILPYNLYIDHE